MRQSPTTAGCRRRVQSLAAFSLFTRICLSFLERVPLESEISSKGGVLHCTTKHTCNLKIRFGRTPHYKIGQLVNQTTGRLMQKADAGKEMKRDEGDDGVRRSKEEELDASTGSCDSMQRADDSTPWPPVTAAL